MYIHELLQLVCRDLMHYMYPAWSVSVCTQREAESKVKVLSKKCEKRLAVGPLPGAWNHYNVVGVRFSNNTSFGGFNFIGTQVNWHNS